MSSPVNSRHEPELPRGSSQSLRWCAILLSCLMLMVAAVENGTRVLVERISRIEGRTAREHAHAIAPPSGSQPVLLFVGNSLLDAGVQVDRVAKALAKDVEVRRFVVEQTTYRDWFYGLRMLFDEGATPKVVVLMMSVDQLAADHTRGEYSAYRLTSHGDIFDLCRELNLHPTQAAGMLLANYSMFYGLRGEIRKVVLGMTMPDLGLLIARFRPVTISNINSNGSWQTTVEQRAAALRMECERRGSRLVLALPPGGDYETLLSAKRSAGRSGVDTLLPFGPGEYGAADYSDGYHLNTSGASKLTTQLIHSTQVSLGTWVKRAK
jgi:hypothetical protein